MGFTEKEFAVKKSKLFILAFCLLLTALFTVFVSAATYGNLTYEISNGEVTITDCNQSASGALTIPAQIKGCPVTRIAYGAFYECSALTSVTIPSSVTWIEDGAFQACSGLTSVEIPSSVEYITGSAFVDCPELKNTVGNLIYLKREENPYYYLVGTTTVSITSCVINENCKSILGAFHGCDRLTSIEIPAGVTSIGACAFGFCSRLTSIIFAEGSQCISIGSSTFSGCESLTSIEIPSSVTSIGWNAFPFCSGLTSVYISDLAAWCKISFGDAIANPCFYAHNLYLNGELITDLVIPSSVTSIGSYAFYGCSSLTSITIPSSVTSIGSYAFSGCSGLTSITIWNADCSIYGSIYDSSSIIPQNTIINGQSGSTAQTYANKFSRTFVALPLPENPLSLSGVYTNGEGDLRFVTRVTSTAGDPEIEYFGTYIVPLSYFTAHELNAGGGEQPGVAAVKYTQSIENGASFAADLDGIPSAYVDTPIFAWSFVKFQGIDAVYTQVLGSFTVSGARLVKGGF